MNTFTNEEQRLYEVMFRKPRLNEVALAEDLSGDRPVSNRLVEKVANLLGDRGLAKQRDRITLVTELEVLLLNVMRERRCESLSELVDLFSQAWVSTPAADRLPAGLLGAFLSVRLDLETDQDVRVYRTAALVEPWGDGAAPISYWKFLTRIALLYEVKQTRVSSKEIQAEMVRRLSDAAGLKVATAEEIVTRIVRELLLDSQTGVVASVVRPLDAFPNPTPILGAAVYPARSDRSGEKKSGRSENGSGADRSVENGQPVETMKAVTALQRQVETLEQSIVRQADYVDLLRRVEALEQQIQAKEPVEATALILPEPTLAKAMNETQEPPVAEASPAEEINELEAMRTELQRVQAERDDKEEQAQQLETLGAVLQRQVADLQARLQNERRLAVVELLSDLAGERSHHVLGQLHLALEGQDAAAGETLISLIRTLFNSLYRQGLSPYLPEGVAIGQKVSGRPEQLVRTYQPDASVVMVGQAGEVEVVVAAFGWKFGDDVIARPLITRPEEAVVKEALIEDGAVNQ